MSDRIKLRMKFEKKGVVKFVGHLDMMRYFQKANRRAGLAVAYSAGFSPHQILSFAAPLGVGIESCGEYLDVEMESLEGAATSVELINKLNAVMAPGIRVTNVVRLPERTPNAMASVAAAGYEVRFRSGKAPDFNVKNQLAAFLNQEVIPYEKETKKGSVTLNLREAIYECYASGDDCIYMLVNASSAGNIKPMMVMEALYRFAGAELPEFACQVTRTDTYTNLGSADEPRFVPLDAVGERF